MIRLLIILIILSVIFLVIYMKVRHDAKRTQKVRREARWQINTVSTGEGITVQLEMEGSPVQEIETINVDDPSFQDKLLDAQAEATDKMILLNQVRETQQRQQKQQG